ncbi:hypothetical protein [Membranihabitans marinus]|uniref:hypothetical protein n=1 Tax=Membranihabitans marinus TaxID=1227546 RepID=UPI001F19AA1B|nr:hypothetical protein [Membranihabitans marinus]
MEDKESWHGDLQHFDRQGHQWILADKNAQESRMDINWPIDRKGLSLNFTMDFPPSDNNYFEFGWMYNDISDTSSITFRIGRSGRGDGIMIINEEENMDNVDEIFQGQFQDGGVNVYLDLSFVGSNILMTLNGHDQTSLALPWTNEVELTFFFRIVYTTSRADKWVLHKLTQYSLGINHLSSEVDRGELIVTEWMLDGDLPAFIELLNYSDKILCLHAVDLILGGIWIKMPNLVLAPYEYAVLSDDSSSYWSSRDIQPLFIGELPRVESIESNGWLKNYNGSIQYLPLLSYPHPRSSVEMKSIFQSCLVVGNWALSADELGSPGQDNTIFETTVPVHQPTVVFLTSNQASIQWPYWISDLTLMASWIQSQLPFNVEENSDSGNMMTLNIDDDKGWSHGDSLGFGGTYVNCNGDVVVWDTVVYYVKGRLPHRGELLVSEIMYNPHPGCPEYIELYNTTKDYLDLEEVVLQLGNQNQKLSLTNDMPPYGVWILTRHPEELLDCYHSAQSEAVFEYSLYTLNNLGLTMSLTNSENEVLDDASYGVDDIHPFWLDSHGISLERRLFGTADRVWKSGYRQYGFNSASFIPEENKRADQPELYLSTQVITPDGDGQHDRLIIYIGGRGNYGSLTINIFDLNGKKINTLANNLPIQEGDFIIWDGRDSRYNPAPSGLYLIWAYHFDELGYEKTHKLTCALSRQ